MKIKKVVETVEVIEVKTPYYYKHTFDDSVIYGKIEEGKTISIDIPHHFKDSREYTLEIDVSEQDGSYLKDKYKSDAEEWIKAVTEFKKWINSQI